jgi:hypothetical protein
MVWPKEKGCNLCHRLWHSDMDAWAIVLSNSLLDELRWLWPSRPVMSTAR